MKYPKQSSSVIAVRASNSPNIAVYENIEAFAQENGCARVRYKEWTASLSAYGETNDSKKASMKIRQCLSLYIKKTTLMCVVSTGYATLSYVLLFSNGLELMIQWESG